MSNCCTPGPGFPNAPNMQQLALNHAVVWEEICMIQQAILAAASQCQPGGGKMCTTVGGDTPMTFITGVESVSVVSGGTGYLVDNPAIRFIPPLGSTAAGATASLTTNGSNILSVNMLTTGSGYQPVPATMSVSSVGGAGAVVEPLVNAAGNIVGINIVSAGTGYLISDTVTAARAIAPNALYTDAEIIITSVGTLGEITSFAILNSGTGYQPSVAEVEIVSEIDPLESYPLGAGFYGSVITSPTGEVTQVIISNTGAGYAPYRPYLVITDPGTGAQTQVNVTAGSVSSVAVIEAGSNYTTGATGIIMNPPTAPLPNPPADPAVVTINTLQNTFGTNPELYWQVWSGFTTDRAISLQLNQVLSYFKALNYTISIQTNPLTGSTIQWKICW